MYSQFNVSRYVLHRLQELGLKHLFGVPGDYVLDFLDEVVASSIQWTGTCNELNAGYAADGYARIKGVGAAVVTYGVGGLSIINAVAGAFAERIPLVVISGAPPARLRESGALVHHLISDYYLQLDMFRKVTADAAILTDSNTAPDIIDRVIRSCVSRKLPVYLEIPSDIALASCEPPKSAMDFTPLQSDVAALADCISDAVKILDCASHPLILSGMEVSRLGLGDDTLHLVESTELPFATMISSKSVLPELHPQFVGLYQGKWSREPVRKQVEDSDCLLALGVWMTDFDTGLFSVNFDRQHMIFAAGDQVCIGNKHYRQIQLGDFIRGMASSLKPRSYLMSHPLEACHSKKKFMPEPAKVLTAARLYECIDDFLDDRMVLLAEPGDAFCAAPEFKIEEAQNFIVQSYYCSIGFCTPAALGVALACPEKRPVVLTGDGAFQMTAQEVSTLIRNRCTAIVIVINNDGYLVERMLHDDGPYNDIQMWRYSKLPETFGAGERSLAFTVSTEEELTGALQSAFREKNKFVLIEAKLHKLVCSVGLQRIGNALRQASEKK